MHLPRPGPGSRRLSAPHGLGAAGAGRALGAARAAAAAAGFARDAGVETAAGDAVRGLVLRLTVAQRLVDLVDLLFEPGFNTRYDTFDMSMPPSSVDGDCSIFVPKWMDPCHEWPHCWECPREPKF